MCAATDTVREEWMLEDRVGELAGSLTLQHHALTLHHQEVMGDLTKEPILYQAHNIWVTAHSVVEQMQAQPC